MSDQDNSVNTIVVQQQLFKIEHTVAPRPDSLVEPPESHSTIEPNPAQPDMFDVEYWK